MGTAPAGGALGDGIVRTILKLGLACGVVYVGPVYLAYQEFRTEVAGATRAGGRRPERELVAVVAGLAERIGVPVALRGHQGAQGRGPARISR